MIQMEVAEKYNLFEEIYIHISKAWQIGKVYSFRKNTPAYLQKIFLLKFDKTVDGWFYHKEFDKFNISIIRDVNPIEDFITKSGLYMDTLLINGKINIVIVVNEDKVIYQETSRTDVVELNRQVGCVAKIFKYVIDEVKRFYKSSSTSTLFKQFDFAPIIMTFKLLIANYQNSELGPKLILTKYFTMFSKTNKVLSEDNLKSCYRYSIMDLLDNSGILYIVDGHEDRFMEFLDSEAENE